MSIYLIMCIGAAVGLTGVTIWAVIEDITGRGPRGPR